MQINHAKSARIVIFDFKKVWKSWDTYSAFLGVRKLASGWNRILEHPANDLCDWNSLRKPGTGKSVYNFS